MTALDSNIAASLCILGDSIALGVPVEATAGGWASRLNSDFQRANKLSVHEYAAEGAKVSDLADLYAEAVSSLNPGVIIFAIGINDLSWSGHEATPLDVFEARYLDILLKSRSKTDKLLVMSILNVSEQIGSHGIKNEQVMAYNRVISKIASATGAMYLDLYGALEPDEFIDGVHPNSRGQNSLCLWVAAELDRLGWSY